eukprot:1050717-Rhodomonas_salina.1
MGVGNVTVDLVGSGNDVAFSSSLRFWVLDPLSIHRVFPSSGPIRGGTNVSIDFDLAGVPQSASCMFAGTT